MSKRVPIKNIYPVLVDIKTSGIEHRKPKKGPLLLIHTSGLEIKKKRRRYTIAQLVISILLLGLIPTIALIVTNIERAKHDVALRSKSIAQNLSDSVEALKNVDPDLAENYLNKNAGEIKELEDIFNKSYNKTFFSILSSVVPAFQGIGTLVTGATSVNINFLSLSKILADLEHNGFIYFQSNGKLLLERLQITRTLIHEILAGIESIKNATANLRTTANFFANLDQTIGTQYIRYSTDVQTLENFLEKLSLLLGSSEERHLLLFFQNPSEIRPGGGFIGSYADLSFRLGQMSGIDVRDIYDPDGQLDLKVIPPEPLQTLTEKWGARDANWFFDFPISARTVTYFLENSKIHQEKNLTFDGAIAININVLESILGLIGPMELPEYQLTISKDNFLSEVQREVEAGKDKKAGHPKRILRVLTPLILERLKSLPPEQGRNLMDILSNHLSAKDIMIFAKDPALAEFFKKNGVDGSVYDLPNDFWGNYLAVVNANIAGGKSDAFIDQTVTVRIDIDTDGGSLVDVNVSRTHHGDQEKDSWWRATNKDFMQLLANPNATFISIQGNDSKSPTLNRNYNADGFLVNDDLYSIESTRVSLNGSQTWAMDGFGKKIFATWLTTPAGQTKTLDLRYQIPVDDRTSLHNGKIYEFIFEKQSGVPTALKIAIAAPFGYRWAENKDTVFTYEKDDLESKTILRLKLQK
ncbi:DUF4012 domain-containing protein [Candidatus Jorgensenbacteria bacterium]|nr:DUF4012 domain-containing protein [Candidatus Jorgensenbacteria bacterium]